MDKYKNKDGIELSYTGNDSHQVLVREVISEAMKILSMYDRNCKISMGMAMSNTKKFLKTNFDIDTKWDLKKGNRWRGNKGQVRYKTWRKNVFELNKRKVGLSKYYVCVKCNKKRKTTRVLHAHHIYSWKKYPKLRYEKKNGVVMCIKCHNGFHRKYKFDALDKPNLLVEYLKGNQLVENFIKENWYISQNFFSSAF